VRFDKSVEYTTRYHRYYLPEILKRPFVAGSVVWNLADFNSETRNESMPHINNKGLLEWNRTPKDPYYYYTAMLVKHPFIKILGASLRGGAQDSLQLLQVANNFTETDLYINGQPLGKQTTENGLAEWHVSFKNGPNLIRVTGKKNGKLFSDQKEIMFRLQPGSLSRAIQPFDGLNILLGANRYFTDSKNEIWIPDQEYRKESWGHIGGKAFRLPNGNLPYGTDKNIIGTDDDPIYQTQQTDITFYRLDVPDGKYELGLYFSELVGGKVQQLVYNLDSTGRTELAVKRIFDVVVNDETVLKNFNIEQECGIATAVRKTFIVTAKDNKGIIILFRAIEGEAVLNAVQLRIKN
jgi:beta-galactosidase